MVEIGFRLLYFGLLYFIVNYLIKVVFVGDEIYYFKLL